MRRTREAIRLVEGENPWITFFKHQVYNRNNCINSFMTGQPGSGKSWAILSICSQLDPEFELENNWFFKAAPLMRALKDYYKDGNSKVGKIWVMDEAGVDLHNLNYFDEINKGLNLFFQTARHRNYFFYGTVPYLSFISKGVRKLATVILRAQGWNSENMTTIIPRINQYNDEIDKFYKRRLIVRTDNGASFCNQIQIKKPKIRLVREYEKLKGEFTSDVFEQTAERIERFENKAREKEKTKKLTLKQHRLISLMQQGFSRKKILETLNIEGSSLTDMIYPIQGTGILIQPLKNKKNRVIRYRVELPKDL